MVATTFVFCLLVCLFVLFFFSFFFCLFVCLFFYLRYLPLSSNVNEIFCKTLPVELLTTD